MQNTITVGARIPRRRLDDLKRLAGDEKPGTWISRLILQALDEEKRAVTFMLTKDEAGRMREQLE